MAEEIERSGKVPAICCYDIVVERYGRAVLRGTNLEVEPGESVSITGESGSGKGLLLAVLAGKVRPLVGEVRVDGEEINYAKTVPMTISHISNEVRLDPRLSGWQWLEYRGNTGGQIPPENEYCALLDRLNISHLKDMTIEDMSDGEAAFLDLAGMLLRDAPVLLIDSVFDKLGRDESETLADLIGEVTDDGKTVVTAINWPENHKCFDRTLELFDGRLEDIT